MAKGKKSKGKVKNRNTEANKKRRKETEIRRLERKMNKLLRLNEEGRKRWTADRFGNKVETTKLQGISRNGPRHRAILTAIRSLRDCL